MSNNYLIHYGIKGMKWGVRHDNPNYKSDQRKRDKAIYGRGGVRRINSSMNKGYSIQSARSREADRINAARRRSRIAGQIGSTAGTIGGALIGYKYSSQIANKFGLDGDDMLIRGAISAGASTVSTQLGRYGGQSVSMLMSGYNPRKFR